MYLTLLYLTAKLAISSHLILSSFSPLLRVKMRYFSRAILYIPILPYLTQSEVVNKIR